MCKMLGPALVMALCVSAMADKFEGALQRTAGYHRDIQHPEVRRYRLTDMGMAKYLDRLRSESHYGQEHEHTFHNSNHVSPELPVEGLYNSNPSKEDKASYQRYKELQSFSAGDYSNHIEHDAHGNHLHKIQQATGLPDDEELSNNGFNNRKGSWPLHHKDSPDSAAPLVRFEDFRNSPTLTMDNDSQSFDTRKAHLSQDQSGFPDMNKLSHQTNSRYNSIMEKVPGKFPSRYRKIPDTEEFYIVKGQVKKFKNIYELLRPFLSSMGTYKNSSMGVPLKPEDNAPKERMAHRVGDTPKASFLSYLPLPSPNWRQILPPVASSSQAPQGSLFQPLAGVPPVYKRPINYGNLIKLSKLVPHFPDKQDLPYLPKDFAKYVKCLLYRRNGNDLQPVWIPYHPSMSVGEWDKTPDNCYVEGPLPTLPPLPVANAEPHDLAAVEQEEVYRKGGPGTRVDKEEEEVSQTTPGILGLPGNVEQKDIVNKEILAQPGTVEEEVVSQETPPLPGTVEEEEIIKNIPEQEKDILNVRQYYG